MADRFALPCPGCSADNQVDATQAGETIACRQCGQPLEVPPLRVLRRQLVSTPPAGGRPTKKSQPTRQPFVARGIFVLGFVLAFIGLATGAVLWYTASQLPTERPAAEIEQVNARVFAAIDQENMSQFWKRWQEEIVSQPPGRWVESQYAANRRVARTQRLVGSIFLGLIPLGVAIMVGSVFLRR